MKGYKAFRKGLICRGYQFKEGEVFEEEKASVCNYGFHFCANPLDTLDYYPLIDDDGNLSDFASVEALDEALTDDKKKYCTKKIKIGAKLSLAGFISASIDYIKESVGDKVDGAKKIIRKKDGAVVATSGFSSQVATSGDSSKVATSGFSSQVATSGDYSKVATSGNYSKVATSGYSSKVATSGNYSKVATSGYSSKVATSGDYSQVATSGFSSQVATTGNYSQVATSGGYSQVATSGDYSKVATSGFSSQVATSGDSSKVATSGNYSKVATSGFSSQVATSGDYSQVATSGDYSKVALNGADSVGANIGIGGIIKGKKGCWITLAEYDSDYKPVCVKSAQIDGEIIKEDTYYRLRDGEFVEV